MLQIIVWFWNLFTFLIAGVNVTATTIEFGGLGQYILLISSQLHCMPSTVFIGKHSIIYWGSDDRFSFS